MTYLPQLLYKPPNVGFELEAPFWTGLRQERLMIQRCSNCDAWRWGPEIVCSSCHSFEFRYQEVQPIGIIYSFIKIAKAVHPNLKNRGEYYAALIELPQAGRVRMIGNLLDGEELSPAIGQPVFGTFEHHYEEDQHAYSLLQWQRDRDQLD